MPLRVAKANKRLACGPSFDAAPLSAAEEPQNRTEWGMQPPHSPCRVHFNIDFGIPPNAHGWLKTESGVHRVTAQRLGISVNHLPQSATTSLMRLPSSVRKASK